MTASGFTPAHQIRAAFARAMSHMYRAEVPLYADLIDIVDDVNRRVLAADPLLAEGLRRRGEFDRLSQERHGAIRVGTGEELRTLRRMFAVMGMHPVGYYDLSAAGVPVHATAFRPTAAADLNRNPFRVFTSLLRLELIDDRHLRTTAMTLLSQRRIFTPRALELTERHERDGGLDKSSADEFVAEVLETFRWHSDTVVSAQMYATLNALHRLLADVVCFRGPHINHLTPRTLDIDAVQAEMLARGIDAKEVIEGPPRRRIPILLRQTSFKALEERVAFRDVNTSVLGTHTARFGEIEQRGLALTPRGHRMYEDLLVEARELGASNGRDYQHRLAATFQGFPDDIDVLRREQLGYFSYRLLNPGAATRAGASVADLDRLIADGVVEASPVIYEDFLPVSAAGIFQSNLDGGAMKGYSSAGAQSEFEQALGVAISDPFRLYEAVEASSLKNLAQSLAALSAEARG